MLLGDTFLTFFRIIVSSPTGSSGKEVTLQIYLVNILGKNQPLNKWHYFKTGVLLSTILVL